MYTIAMLVVPNAFSPKMQALAGGVFNMLAHTGKIVGIATTAMIAQQMAALKERDGSGEALLRVCWYYNCGMGFLSVLVSAWDLRSVGKLGVKVVQYAGFSWNTGPRADEQSRLTILW